MAGKARAKAEEKEEKALESKSLYLRGVITEAMFGKRDFKKGKDQADKYRISLKIEPEDMDALREAADPYYEECDEKWVPKWYSSDDPEDYEFLNLASNFDIKIGKKEDGKLVDLGTMMQFIEKNGNINGSKAVVMVTLKKGAIYPQAILIKELHQTTIDDLFKDFEDGDELPFD